MDLECITSRSELEAVVGSQPLGSMLKSIEAFDQHCVDLLELSPLAVLGTTDRSGARRSVVVGGAPGFAKAPTPSQLDLEPPADLDAKSGAGAGLLFLVPGLGETLRVNGRMRADRRGVDVEEVYVHCAKAVIRSELWRGRDAAPDAAIVMPHRALDGPLGAPGIAAFLARSRFAVITSSDRAGADDASPKGDPSGFIQVIDGRTVTLPDRPGNRRTDTFHNLVEQSAIGVLALAPGDDRALELRGNARLTTDTDLLSTMEVGGRRPKLAVAIEVEAAALTTPTAIAASRIWDLSTHIDPATLPKMTRVWADHVKQNKQRGLAASALRKAVSASVLDRAIAHDYRTNLY